MKKKLKFMFAISAALNVLLVAAVVIGIITIQQSQHTLAFSAVEQPLTELEGVIAHQIDQDWSKPNVVTAKITEVTNGLATAGRAAHPAAFVTGMDTVELDLLQTQLARFPSNTVYDLPEITDQQIEGYAEGFRLWHPAGCREGSIPTELASSRAGSFYRKQLDHNRTAQDCSPVFLLFS
ncbi:hypothetical protein CR205_03415 [Alteribacter lacisalsi]|uniref:Uncharacterized protein n=1 Tax=Alteribacter lacisalsi TaxID=2045244 RepID=A0A2W0HJH4_9BACI|nr:hypothetical protein [Alteribacter lacisalsi]PYZ97655.1 hypothetical protein CR205_03415 [Alteribacter lacisalsi]